MRYTLQVGDEIVKVNLYKELEIDEDNLNEAMANHPRILAFLGRVHAEMLKKVKLLEITRKEKKSERIMKLAESISITQAREQVDSDEEYVKITKKLISLEHKRDELERILEAFRHRKDLLQTLSANIRKTPE